MKLGSLLHVWNKYHCLCQTSSKDALNGVTITTACGFSSTTTDCWELMLPWLMFTLKTPVSRSGSNSSTNSLMVQLVSLKQVLVLFIHLVLLGHLVSLFSMNSTATTLSVLFPSLKRKEKSNNVCSTCDPITCIGRVVVKRKDLDKRISRSEECTW